MNTATTLRLPCGFVDDHMERGLGNLTILRATARYYWVNANDPEMADLLADAAWYAEGNVDDPRTIRLARTLLAAVQAFKARQGCR